MKRSYLITVFLLFLPITWLIYRFDVIAADLFILILTAASFLFMFGYMINDIKEDKLKKFNHYHYEPIQQVTTERADIILFQKIIICSYYFSSMIFITSTIIILLFDHVWPFKIATIMGIIGFNVVAVLIHILEDIYHVLSE